MQLGALVRQSRPKSDRGKDALAGSREPVALNLLDLKSFAERIASPDLVRQTAEVHIRIALMNRFNALATVWIERMAGRWPGEGKSRFNVEFCINADLLAFRSWRKTTRPDRHTLAKDQPERQPNQ
jgi:hypothetical protein